jgi:hypothetical protein
MITADNFIRHKLLAMIVERIRQSVKPLLCDQH